MPTASLKKLVGKVFTNIKSIPAFDKDFKKLKKKFRTLEDDLSTCIKTLLKLFHKEKKKIDGIFLIPELGIENTKVYKVKSFTCRSLMGRGVKSGIRIIYAFNEEEDSIIFIEIYFKGDKETEDRKRILKEFKKGDDNGRNT